MSIIFDKNNKTFTLHTNSSSYQMQIDPYGFLLHLYYGRRTEGCMDYLLTYADRGFSGNPYDTGVDRTYSMDALPQEFPHTGLGDYRNVACTVVNADQSRCCDLRYAGHEIRKGKYALDRLPAVYADEAEAETLEIVLKDAVNQVEARLLYGVLPEADVITRSVLIKNGGSDRIYLDKVMSACLDFVAGDYDLISFHGRHCMDRMYQRQSLSHGTMKFGSRRGTSSHQYNPMMILADPKTTEETGSCWSMTFMYSGSFQAEVEKDQFNQVRALIGLQQDGFYYPMEPGDTFTAPEVILSFSANGLNRLSQNLHACIRNHVCRGKYKNAIRPILVNSWEGAYFDFNGETIYQLAVHAKELGIDMVVMDDGWFGKRDDDFSGLGDWYVNEEKLGGSLGHLIERINALGVKFGIWIEPECVNEDSQLYREHPDWALTVPGRNPIRARSQLVLDFSRKEVVDTIFDMICKVLDQGNIEYVKWDMNRSLDVAFSRAAKEQGAVAYDYVLGLYDFLERLIQRYPNILIEGCSGGGGRFDAGMLYYTPQIWCSDNTDALDRIKIQYGTSFGYPVSAMGSHVSAVPNHQTGRSTTLQVRSVVAMAGTFGYELDLSTLSDEAKDIVRKQIKEYRKYAQLINYGVYYRLTNPFEEEAAAWEFVAEDGSEALLNVIMQDIHGNMTVDYVRLQGLIPGRMYRSEESGRLYPADALMETGMPIPVEYKAYRAYQIHLIAE